MDRKTKSREKENEQEFHIINVGNSLLTNFKSKKGKKWGIIQVQFSDEEIWKRLYNNKDFFKDILNFVNTSPKENSAELNSFLRITENKKPHNVSVYLFGTNTTSNEICKITIEKFLKKKGFCLLKPKKISGYFWEASNYDQNYAKNKFEQDISLMLDRMIYLIKNKQQEGFNVFVNPTGGFKAHVIACAMAGLLLGAKVYYIHEEFNNLIFLPSLFYLPKGREIQLLENLKDSKPQSGQEYKKLEKKFPQEIERLENYGLIEREQNEFNKFFRIKITNRGILYLKLKEEV